LPLKVIRESLSEVIGQGHILLSSPHVISRERNQNIEVIVEEAALLSKAHALIQRAKRNPDPSNFALAQEEFEASIQKFSADFGLRCVLEILAIDEPGIEIRTSHSESEHNQLADIVRDFFATDFDVRISKANPYTSDNHSTQVKVISILLGPNERRPRRGLLVSRIADAVKVLNAVLGYLKTDQRTSGVLD
jgi:hypothetical protein